MTEPFKRERLSRAEKLRRARRLREARERAGYDSPAEAARAFGWNENTYKSTENGTRGLYFEKAEEYGKALGVSAVSLLTGDESVQRPSRLDLMLLPLQCEQPECRTDFSVALRGLISREAVICPRCASRVDLKQYHRTIKYLVGVAADLDKIAAKGD